MTLPLDKLAILAADVGSSRNFGWACECDGKTVTGDSIEGLAHTAVRVAQDGLYLALGFECPLSIPCPLEKSDLGKQREGEAGKPWSAGAGPIVAANGLQQLCWVLRYVLANLGGNPLGTVDWAVFQRGSHKLFLWEAFVSGRKKTESHTGDALAAVGAFKAALPTPATASSVVCNEPISLGGLALIWTGWSKDERLLRQPILVIEPARDSA